MFRLEEPLPAPPMLSDGEFAQLRRFIHQAAGIAMSPGKRSLIQSRLAKRLRQLRLNSYAAYWRMIADPANALERQYAINLLSTNETYFSASRNTSPGCGSWRRGGRAAASCGCGRRRAPPARRPTPSR